MAVLLFLTFAAWSMGSAVGSSPDEGYVLTSIWCANTPQLKEDDKRWKAPTQWPSELADEIAPGRPIFSKGETCRHDLDRSLTVWVPWRVAESHSCYWELGTISAKCQKSLTDELVSTDQVNQNFGSLYPSRYMKVMNQFIEDDVQQSALKIRLFNSLLASVLIVFALSLNKKLISDLSITLMAVITPVGIYLLSSVNTSSWAISGTAIFSLSILAINPDKLRTKHTALSMVLALVGLCIANSSRFETKYQLLVISIFVFLYKFPRIIRPRYSKRIIFRAIISVFLLLVLLSQIPNNPLFDLFGDLSLKKDDSISLLVTNLVNLPLFVTGFFGSWGLGWFEILLSQTAWLLPTAAFVITYAAATLGSNRQNKFLSVLMITSLLLIIVLYLQKYFVEIRDMVQPRYFFPLLIGISFSAAANKKTPFSNAVVSSAGLLTVVANSVALRNVIRRYVTGQNLGITESLNSPRDWWWTDKDSGTTLWAPAPETVWLIGSLAFAMLFAVIIYERKLESTETSKI
jgi:hypothetical protein